MYDILGKKIRAMREERNLTQEQMGVKLNISRQKYARIENGINTITLDILSQIADIFSVKISDITKVLDNEPVIEYREGETCDSAVGKVYEMLDLFYANKHAYDRIHYKDIE